MQARDENTLYILDELREIEFGLTYRNYTHPISKEGITDYSLSVIYIITLFPIHAVYVATVQQVRGYSIEISQKSEGFFAYYFQIKCGE